MNYQTELDKILSDSSKYGKKLFLHSCCAPCSSYVLTYLRGFFDITVFYFNPNITGNDEYFKRVAEQKRLIAQLNEEAVKSEDASYEIKIVEGTYDTALFFDCVRGLEKEPEGGARCEKCFRLRLFETAKKALEYGADYFGTTLTISPLKNAQLINEIGLSIEKELSGGISDGGTLKWLPSDFKKKDGYKQSIELSKKYDLYRQDYCGCEFSKREGKR